LASWWLAGPIEALADAYQTSFYASGLGFFAALGVCAIGVVMGLLGSAVAVFKHLRDIEPN
jgi:cell division transport system permease protein